MRTSMEGAVMKQIYFSESFFVKYNDLMVEINSNTISSEELEGKAPCEYAYRAMRSQYKNVLSKQFDNIVILSGAGTSVGIGVGGHTGKTMKELWQSVVCKIGFDKIRHFAEQIGFTNIDKEYSNLEELISRAILATEFLNDKTEKIQDLISNIEAIIRDCCTIELPDNAPHSLFLRKITSRKLKYARVKLFTLNYDLLFEQAASRGGYVLVDGFSFNSPRVFDGNNFDYDIVVRSNSRLMTEENYAPKVLHLYKPHGSLDWKQVIGNGKMSFIKAYPNENPLLIYPSNSKFKHSYEQPFFEMISRFQQEIRTKNTLLISIGFSFYDLHFKNMIVEAINTNPGLTVVIASPDVSNEETYSELKEKAKTMKNVILAAETFCDFSKSFPYSNIYDFSNEVIEDESIRQ